MAKWSPPSVTSQLPADLKRFVDSVTQRLRELSGTMLTRSELVRSGLVQETKGGNLTPVPQDVNSIPPPNTTTPATPTNLQASGALGTVLLTWDAPVYAGHAYTEVFRASTDDFSAKVKIGQTGASVYADDVGQGGSTHYYWVRHVSSLYGQDNPGAFNGTPGTAATTGRAQSGDVQDGAITQLKIGLAAVDDARIASLSAAKIVTGTLAAGTQITVGTTVTIDGATGSLISATATKKVVMNSGDVVSYRIVGGIEYPYKALARVENGTADNGSTITIPGFFATQPRVTVSPANMMVYDKNNSAQSQSLNCSPGSVTETSAGSMVWQFTPTAQLVLASGTSSTSPNTRIPSSGEDSTNTWYSHTGSSGFVTPANTTKVQPTVQVQSVRGTGTAPNYFKRTVVVSVEYWNGSAWTGGATVGTINIGSSITETAATQLAEYSFTGAGTWNYRIKFVASDTDGTTFTSGSGGFTTSEETRTGSTASANQTATGIINYSADTGASALNTSWEIYELVYSWSRKVTFTGAVQPLPSGGKATWTVSDQFNPNEYINNTGFTTNPHTKGPDACSRTITGSSLSYNRNFIAGTAESTNGNMDTNAFIESPQAIIRRRTPITNSSTPANHAVFNSGVFTLSSASQLATGTLNWIAIGE